VAPMFPARSPKLEIGPAEPRATEYHLPVVPLDRSSPLHRFRVDPRAQRRSAVLRLEALGVAAVEVSAARSRALLARFVHEFVEPRHAAALGVELARPRSLQRAIDFDRWLRPDCVRRQGVGGCVRWLLAGASGRSGQQGSEPARTECVRFERAAELPALAIDLTTLEDAWAASWPGVFVSFDAGRAVVVTLDYEEVRCDVRAARATPYR
jgi:hypothetical protein